MKCSVVIPLYNKERTVSRAIHSVLKQTLNRACEPQIIVVDDGSTDASLYIAKKIQRANLHRNIVIHSQLNAGVSSARNAGIALAENNYVAFLDADDSYEPEFLEEIASLSSNFSQASVFATSYRFVNASTGRARNARLCHIDKAHQQQLLADYFLSAASGDLPITSSSVCIKKQALERIGGFPLDENMGEDQSVWSQLALSESIGISRRVCANYYEQTDQSLMQTIATQTEMPYSRRLQKKLANKEIEKSKVLSVKRYIASHLIDLGRRNIEREDLVSAAKFLHDPRSWQLPVRWLYYFGKLAISRVLAKLSAFTTSSTIQSKR